jgi:archaellum component FlaF (FlaF/FlaG flagellin family)
MNLALLLNVTLVVLLSLTIVYAVILNNRLKKIRNARQELQTIVHEFISSSENTKVNIQHLVASSSQIQESLDKKVREALSLYNDLKLIVDKGEEIASNLETKIHTPAAQAARNHPPLPHQESPPRNAPPKGQKEEKVPPQKKAQPSLRDPQEAILRAIREMR